MMHPQPILKVSSLRCSQKAHRNPLTHSIENISVKQENQPRSKFFSRLVSIPVVKDSLTTVYHYVNENSLGRYALTSTEGTLQKASVIVAPYVERFSDQLKTMDEMGYKSLDYVEQYTIVNKPTAELLANVTEPVRQVRTTAKGYLDTTVHVVTWPVDRAAQNILDNLEYAVDRVLPAAAATAKEPNHPLTQQERAYSLAIDTKARLMSRLPSAVDQIPRSRTELQQTLQANTLLQGAFDRLQKLDQSLRHTTETTKRNIITTPIETLSKTVHDRYEAARSFTDQRINNVTAELVAHLDHTIAYVQKHNHLFPEAVRTRLQPLVSFAGQEYDIVREQVLKTDISSVQKAKNVLALSTNYILPLMKDSMDALHEELRYYRVYMDKSRNDALNTLRGHIETSTTTIKA
ncbi:hypothetical protein K450DRAFT_256624 [Umbelopsis ramanniana AG]|uniref:Lipid storage droplets surface-binding protein 1 n=1 Tax=Umbelopsis ramanniana AG TaxID=1314678 RepID=A0AAD5E541_UMBRA|nr:uncharacterized protein K450DRAFT_256624 [Umbelopsis ramanniana AG]KAI8576530.1 hypothetical protein K450DRAFT_256624 [Umbelopsis ramanniana AG]